MGIQTACFFEGRWWFGCYGDRLLVTDASFELEGVYDVDFGCGIAAGEGGRLLRGVSLGRWQGKAMGVRSCLLDF